MKAAGLLLVLLLFALATPSNRAADGASVGARPSQHGQESVFPGPSTATRQATDSQATATNLNAAGDGLGNFRRMKYGFFAHYVWGGSAYGVTRNRDGSLPISLDDLANRFDAAGFADDLESMGVEYVIFTAWHANMNCLWPSAKMNQWLSGHSSQRDLLGEMLAAVKAKGISVLFYTHPRDGHDLDPTDQLATGWNGTIDDGNNNPDWNVFDRTKWNNFINDIYGELIDRYGSQIDGLFIDEGTPLGDSWRVVDYPRLRQTIKSRQPDLILVQNFYGSIYSCDVGATEAYYWDPWIPGSNPDSWPATGRPMSMVMGGNWFSTLPEGTPATRYGAAEMFRLTVLRAGINTAEGGGINWAAGPYPGGGWEEGVLSQMQQLGAWIAPIRRSISNTYPSQSWITPPGATIDSLAAGMVATRSADDSAEFIHVLRAPAGNSLTVPPPVDGRGYLSATLLKSGHAVELVRQNDGSLTFTLQGADAWDPLDTVIELSPVTVSWIGNDQSFGADTGLWNEAADNFTGGAPEALRFRSGDNVGFLGNGAANIFFGPASGAVGELRFSGKDYDILPQGTPVLTLTSGAVEVDGGVTARFHQSSMAGTLSLAGTNGITKSGAGILSLELPASYPGNTFLLDGTLAFIEGGLGQGNLVFGGGTLLYLPGNTADVSSRIRHSAMPIKIDTGGNNITYATALSATNSGGLTKLGSGTLSLAGGLHLYTGPTSVYDGTLRLDPGTAASVPVPNAGFEAPVYAPRGWSYGPNGAGWSFQPGAGTASNGSPWIDVAPEGAQGAFLQNDGAMNTTINVNANGNYLLSFAAGNRPNFHPTALIVQIDGATILTLSPGWIGSGGDFNRFQSDAFRLVAGAHTLAFQGVANGLDTDTVIDNLLLTGVGRGALPVTTELNLAGATATFDPGSGPVTLASLSGVAGARVTLAGTDLVINGPDTGRSFAGSLVGTGNVTNGGTLRLVGAAALDFAGAFTNYGVLDVINWSGSLPNVFDNHGLVLDQSAVRITTVESSANEFFVTIEGYKGHSYQLQRADSLGSGWENVGSPVPGNNSMLHLGELIEATQVRYFYRVIVGP